MNFVDTAVKFGNDIKYAANLDGTSSDADYAIEICPIKISLSIRHWKDL